MDDIKDTEVRIIGGYPEGVCRQFNPTCRHISENGRCKNAACKHFQVANLSDTGVLMYYIAQMQRELVEIRKQIKTR